MHGAGHGTRGGLRLEYPHAGPHRHVTGGGGLTPRTLLVLALLGTSCTAIVPPAPPPAGSPSAARLAQPAFAVGRRDYALVDRSRPNDARCTGDCAPRRLTTTVWFPRAAPGPHPVVLYSHGFFSTRRGGTYLAEWLAGLGYVVAAPDHPLTARATLRGRVVDDVVHQPQDLRFLLDTLLAWDERERPFPGAVDAERVGVVGLSLGGMTATLAAFDPRLRDPRIRAAVSIAGPLTVFGAPYFAGAAVDFLMVAGDADVVVDYATNAPLALERVPGGTLLTIAGASHAGFDDAAGGLLRVLGNPDTLACWWLDVTLDLHTGRDTLAELRGTGDGVLVPPVLPHPCQRRPPCGTLDPARQQLITQLAVGAFLDRVLAPDPARREAAARYLAGELAHDFPEARVAAAAPRIPLVGARAVRWARPYDGPHDRLPRAGSTPNRSGSRIRPCTSAGSATRRCAGSPTWPGAGTVRARAGGARGAARRAGRAARGEALRRALDELAERFAVPGRAP